MRKLASKKNWILFAVLLACFVAIFSYEISDQEDDETYAPLEIVGVACLAAAGAVMQRALWQDRAQASAAIGAERDRIADLMQSIPEGVALWDADGTLTAYNQAFVRRRTSPEMIRRGLNYRDFVANNAAKAGLTGDDAKAYVDRRMAAFAAVDGTPYELAKPDGSVDEVRFFRARNGGVVGVYRDVTELKRGQAQLDAERALLADTLAAIPDGILLWDANARLAAVNAAAARMPLIGETAAVGTRYADFARNSLERFPVVDTDGRPLPSVEERLASQANPTGEPHEFGYADGTWLEIRKFATHEGGVVAVYRDVTQRKRNEATLAAERARLKDILEAIPDGIALWDSQTRLTAFNPAAERMPVLRGVAELGMTYREFAEKSVSRGIIRHADTRAIPELGTRLADFADPRGAPKEFLYEDDTWIESRKFRARDGGVVSVYRDVTERHKALEALERQRRLLQEIMDALPDGLQYWGPDERLSLFNRAAEEQRRNFVPLAIGVMLEDYNRRAIAIGAIPEARGQEEAYLAQRLALHRNPEPRAVEVLRGDGSWEEMRKVPMSDGGCLSVFRDITEAKRAQAKLREQRDELARRLEERERLMAERDSAEASSRAKTEFLAMMSHELRTPMNGVIATTGLLARTRLADEQRLYLDTVQRSAQSLLTIINDVLDWAKLEEGRVEIEAIDCAPAQIADNVVSLLRPAASQKGIELALDLDPALPEYGRLDPARLRQILLNLVGNAVKFTAEGHVRVRLKAEPRAGGGGGFLLSLEVEDSGIGIAPESVPKLFDRFTQADGSISRRFGGTGLGLAIVKRLLDLMGGSIDVSSRPGEGSRFVVRLPMAPGKRPENVAAPFLPAPGRALKLLVAEDNAINRMVVEHLLRELGHKAEFAVDGAEAVTKARAGDYDAILMDVQMPDIDGIKATKLIRALDGPRARVPIVALTANAMVGDRERYLESGMDDYVSKPIDAYELAAALARVAGGPEPAPGAAPPPAGPASNEAGRAKLAGLVDALRRGAANSIEPPDDPSQNRS